MFDSDLFGELTVELFDDPPSFSARVSTTFTPDRSGPWTFGLRSVGDATLSIDGKVILSNDDAEIAEIVALGKPELRLDVDVILGATYVVSARLRRISDGDGLSGLILGCVAPFTDDPIGEAAALADTADVTVLVVGTNGDWETEGRDRDDTLIPGDQDELTRRFAATSTRTVVVFNAGSAIAMPWIDDVEPQGRLLLTLRKQLANSPTALHHPGRDGLANYGEGRLIGHRWYDTKAIQPLFPFGFGLGYGQIELTNALHIGTTAVEVHLVNRSHRDGVAVVRVYAHDPAEQLDDGEPDQWLVGFAKVRIARKATAVAIVKPDAQSLQQWTLLSTPSH